MVNSTTAIMAYTGARPGGRAAPDLSTVPVLADPNLVFHAGTPVTVQMIIPLTGPAIDFYNNSHGSIQILADVQGYGVAR